MLTRTDSDTTVLLRRQKDFSDFENMQRAFHAQCRLMSPPVAVLQRSKSIFCRIDASYDLLLHWYVNCPQEGIRYRAKRPHLFSNRSFTQKTAFVRNPMSASTKSRPAGRPMSASKHSPRWIEAIRYKCHFCRNVLRKVPLESIWFLLLPLGFRRLYCPHCFEMKIRPSGWLRLLISPLWILFNFLRGK